MKDIRQQIIEILKKRVQKLIVSDLISPLFWEDFADEILALPLYPKEFVVYILKEVYFRAGDKKFWLTNNKHFDTLNELYEYYKTIPK